MEENSVLSAFATEKASIEKISFSDRYLGLYERGERVFLEVDYKSAREGDYTYYLKLTDGWGNICHERKIVAKAGDEKCIADLGEFDLGWYRVSLESESGEVFNEYMAFAVVVALGERDKYDDTTLGTDVAAEYEPKTMALGDEFIRSLKLLGFPWLRSRTDMRDWAEQVREYRRKLKQEGFKVTSVSTDDMHAMPQIRSMDLRDTYTKYKNAPALNDVKNEMYEIQNEADLFFKTPPLPDTLAAYTKAAFIGLLDSEPQALTSMTSTSFCADAIYYDVTLQNGILDYSNIYNFHGYEGIESKAAYARKVSLAYSPADSIRPTFMTENGRKVWAGADGVALFDQLRMMCRYAVKSSAKILAEGCDKWFWFISRAFLEAGGGFGNAHAWTHQPYPVFAVTANLTYQLGKGIYKGKLAGLPEGGFGYVFDRGESDVAIVFASKSCNMSVKADKLTVVDMFGVEQKMVADVDGFIAFELGIDPVYLRFDGRAEDGVYYESAYEVLECAPLKLSEEQRIVLNPVWEDQNLNQTIIMQKGYIFKESDEQRVTLRIYNLNDKPVSGRAFITPEYADHFEVQISNAEFSVDAMGRADIDMVIKTTGKAKMNSMGDILFGATLSDGREVSSAVCRYWFKLDDMEISDEDIRCFEGYTDEANWNIKNIMYPGSMTFEADGDEVTLKADHGGAYAQWYFPEFFVKDAGVFEGADGLVLRRKHSHNTGTKLTAFICTKDGRAYWSGDASGVAYTDDWRTIVYPWDTFVLFASPEGMNDPRPFDPMNIYKIRIGASGTPKDFIPDTTIKDFGIFYDNMGATKPHPNTIALEGVEEGETYESAEGLSLIATLPNDAIGDIRVFVGKSAYGNFTVEGKRIYVDLSGLDRGEYTIQVSAKTAVNYRYVKYVTFYIEK